MKSAASPFQAWESRPNTSFAIVGLVVLMGAVDLKSVMNVSLSSLRTTRS